MKKIILIIVLFLVCTPIYPNAQTLIISEGELSETIVRDQFSFYLIDPYFIDMDKLITLMDRLEKETYEAPKNATIDKNGDIISGKSGLILDRGKFMEQFMKFFYSDLSYNIRLPKKVTYPKVDSELLDNIRDREIGSFQTYYRTENKERSHNIHLAAEAINNHVLLPGEEFSFNRVVGKRTKEKGYMRAPVIVKGELSEDIGGGICQISSTLYNAVLLDGIEIIERYSHSRKVPYVPPGKDATVSWWGPDFVFKNNYSQPILIRASAKNGKVLIRIFTSDKADLKQ